MIKVIFALCLLFISPLHAVINDQVFDAEMFFQAGEFSKSREIYQALQKESLSKQQALIIQLNLATILIAEGRYEEALQAFETVHLGDDPSPLLQRQYHFDRSVALLNRAIDNTELLNESEEGFLEACAAILRNLDTALEALALAEKGDRHLAVIEGRDLGEPYPSFQSLYDNVKTLLVQVRQRQQSYALAHLKEKELLEAIDQRLNRLIAQVDQWGVQGKVKERFLKNVALLESNQRVLWDHLHGVPWEDGKKQVFSEAENHYTMAIDLMKEGDLWQARQSFAAAAVPIRILLDLSQETDPFIPLLKGRHSLRIRQESMPASPLKQALYHEEGDLSHYLLALLQQTPKEEEATVASALREVLIHKVEARERILPLHALEDLLLYQQISEEETTSLSALLEEMDEGLYEEKDSANILAKLWAVKKRFQAQRSFIDEEQKKQIDRSVPPLEQLLALRYRPPLPSLDQVYQTVEQVLKNWDAKAFLISKSKKLLKVYAGEVSHSKLEICLLAGQKTVEQMEDLPTEPFLDHLQHYLLLALNETLASQQSLMTQHTSSAQLYFQAARHNLERLIRDASRSATLSAGEQLQGGVMEEELSLEENQQLQKIETEEDLIKPLIQILEETQQSALTELALFEESPDKEGIEQWEEILELVQSGRTNASAVFTYLDLERPELDYAFAKQEAALKDWKKALSLLNGDDPGDNEGDNEDEGEDENDEQDSQQAPPQQVLELYQNMEQDDQKVQPQEYVPVKKGLRPW